MVSVNSFSISLCDVSKSFAAFVITPAKDVLFSVRCVCQFVFKNYAKTTVLVSMKTGGKVQHGPRSGITHSIQEVHKFSFTSANVATTLGLCSLTALLVSLFFYLSQIVVGRQQQEIVVCADELTLLGIRTCDGAVNETPCLRHHVRSVSTSTEANSGKAMLADCT